MAFAVSYAGFAFDNESWLALLPWFVAAGIGIGLAETAQHAAVARNEAEAVRGSAFGLLAGIQSVGNVVASGAAGIIWTVVGPSWAFAGLAIAMAVAALILSMTPSVESDDR